MRVIFLWLCALGLWLGGPCLFQSTRGAEPTPKLFQMRSPDSSTTGGTSIDGGARQDPANWPATLKFSVNGRFTCTSTIVGDQVILTAAHCVADNSDGEVFLPADNLRARLHCDRDPNFKAQGLINDVALCISDRRFPSRFAYETIDARFASLPETSEIFLLGYGCRNVNDVGNPNTIGQLYGGSARVSKLPTPPEVHVETEGGVVICPGDSGGAAYALADNDQVIGPRSIIGVNSGYDPLTRVSAIMPFDDHEMQFIIDWSRRLNVLLCGIHAAAANCRDRYVPRSEQ